MIDARTSEQKKRATPRILSSAILPSLILASFVTRRGQSDARYEIMGLMGFRSVDSIQGMIFVEIGLIAPVKLNDSSFQFNFLY